MGEGGEYPLSKRFTAKGRPCILWTSEEGERKIAPAHGTGWVEMATKATSARRNGSAAHTSFTSPITDLSRPLPSAAARPPRTVRDSFSSDNLFDRDKASNERTREIINGRGIPSGGNIGVNQ